MSGGLQGKIFRPKDYCVFIPMPGEGFILDPKQRTYYYCNESAVPLLQTFLTAWQLGGKAKAGVSFETLKKVLQDAYAISEDAAAPDLRRFLNSLLKKGLIEETRRAADLSGQAAPPQVMQQYKPPAIRLAPVNLPKSALHQVLVGTIWRPRGV